jgi:hypothetical protein
MIQINLLPKEYLKNKRAFAVGKSGLYVVASAAAVVAMLCGVTFWQMHQITALDESIARANQRAAMLRQDIQMVDALTDVKSKITDRSTGIVPSGFGSWRTWRPIFRSLSGWASSMKKLSK